MTETTAQQLEAVVAQILASTRSARSAVEVTALIGQLEVQARLLATASRHLIADMDRRGVAGEYGATSTSALLQQLLRISSGEASARVKQAREFTPRVALTGEVLEPLFSHVGQALDAGEISVAHARIIAKTRSDLPAEVDAACGDAAEAFLVGQAKQLNPTQLGYAATRLKDTLNPDGRFSDEKDQQRRRYFALTVHKDGSSTPSGHFTPELTAILRPVLDSLSAPQPAGDLPDVRTAGQRCHDAIADTALMLLRSGTLPDAGGVPVTVMVTVSAEDLQRAEHGENVLVEDSYGTPLPLETITAITAELQIGSVTLDTTGGILSYGRTRRLASCAQRRALAVRDKGCAFPGCTRPAAWTEVHHIHEWTHGGPTDLTNLVLLCRYHHRHFQQAGWTVRIGDTGKPEWLPPKWIDQDQQPRHNTAHDRPPIPVFD